MIELLTTNADCHSIGPDDLELRVECRRANETVFDCTDEAVFSVSQPGVIDLSPNGVLLGALRPGVTRIEARYEGVVGTSQLELAHPDLVDMRLEPNPLKIPKWVEPIARLHRGR